LFFLPNDLQVLVIASRRFNLHLVLGTVLLDLLDFENRLALQLRLSLRRVNCKAISSCSLLHRVVPLFGCRHSLLLRVDAHDAIALAVNRVFDGELQIHLIGHFQLALRLLSVHFEFLTSLSHRELVLELSKLVVMRRVLVVTSLFGSDDRFFAAVNDQRHVRLLHKVDDPHALVTLLGVTGVNGSGVMRCIEQFRLWGAHVDIVGFALLVAVRGENRVILFTHFRLVLTVHMLVVLHQVRRGLNLLVTIFRSHHAHVH
jgi:hypothetical protein